MTPAEIWTKAIDMTLAQPAGPDALRDLADAFDRERDGEIVRAVTRFSWPVWEWYRAVTETRLGPWAKREGPFDLLVDQERYKSDGDRFEWGVSLDRVIVALHTRGATISLLRPRRDIECASPAELRAELDRLAGARS